MNAIIGRKLGMTRIFDDSGVALPVTVIEAGPCPVVQIREDPHGRRTVQIGFGVKKARRASKAELAHAKNANLDDAPATLREFPLQADDEDVKPGAVIKVDVFAQGDRVKVSGVTKGRGFQGVVKRHGFGGGPATHGNTRYRRPGSMGPGTDPSRVIKGKKLPGQHGSKQRTQVGLHVLQVDVERNLLFVSGAVPGPPSGVVTVRKQGGRSRYA